MKIHPEVANSLVLLYILYMTTTCAAHCRAAAYRATCAQNTQNRQPSGLRGFDLGTKYSYTQTNYYISFKFAHICTLLARVDITDNNVIIINVNNTTSIFCIINILALKNRKAKNWINSLRLSGVMQT